MPIRVTVVLAAAVVVALVAKPLAGSNPQVEPDQRYLLVAAERTSTMQDELSEVAGQGFRIVTGAPTSGNEMAVFLERTSQPPDTYAYQLLATTRSSTFEEELQEAAAAGFRLLPQTLISKKRRFGGNEIVAILERPPGTPTVYEYRLLATTRTSTLQAEVEEGMQSGFTIAGLVSVGEHVVILEREKP